MTTSRELKSRIISILAESLLINTKDKLVVAVSGGMDSMFLLNMFIELKKIKNIELIIAHINHNIRSNSISDEKFVLAQGKRSGIPVIVKQLDYKSKLKSESTEAWARKHRYEQLELIRKEVHFDKIATAHHANDQIETVLQRISEKSGIGGLRGIHPHQDKIIRPMLMISKKDIKVVVNDLKIEYINDETNRNTDIPRNYFRHKVIPEWEARFPNLGEAIQAICDSSAENQLVINHFIEKLKNDIVTEELDNTTNNLVYRIDNDKFQSQLNQVKLLLIRRLVGKSPWRKHQWDEAYKIVNSAKIGKIYNFTNHDILKDRKEWIIRPKFIVIPKPIIVELNQTIRFGNTTFRMNEVQKYSLNENSNIEFIDGTEIIGKKLVLRRWQEGDMFQPLGMKGTKKVSDFLIDEKVHQFEKENQLVLISNKEIIWVCGRRISEKVKINEHTKRYLELSISTNVG